MNTPLNIISYSSIKRIDIYLISNFNFRYIKVEGMEVNEIIKPLISLFAKILYKYFKSFKKQNYEEDFRLPGQLINKIISSVLYYKEVPYAKSNNILNH
jgi:hypothetical protein